MARHHGADFEKVWIQSGIAKRVPAGAYAPGCWTTGSARMSVDLLQQQQIHALCFATDGSAKKEKPGQAGWGCFRHVRAHEGHRMNERADALAKQGGQGLRQREGSYYRPPSPLFRVG